MAFGKPQSFDLIVSFFRLLEVAEFAFAHKIDPRATFPRLNSLTLEVDDLRDGEGADLTVPEDLVESLAGDRTEILRLMHEGDFLLDGSFPQRHAVQIMRVVQCYRIRAFFNDHFLVASDSLHLCGQFWVIQAIIFGDASDDEALGCEL